MLDSKPKTREIIAVGLIVLMLGIAFISHLRNNNSQYKEEIEGYDCDGKYLENAKCLNYFRVEYQNLTGLVQEYWGETNNTDSQNYYYFGISGDLEVIGNDAMIYIIVNEDIEKATGFGFFSVGSDSVLNAVIIFEYPQYTTLSNQHYGFFFRIEIYFDAEGTL